MIKASNFLSAYRVVPSRSGRRQKRSSIGVCVHRLEIWAKLAYPAEEQNSQRKESLYRQNFGRFHGFEIIIVLV